jgi:hypothetical protein
MADYFHSALRGDQIHEAKIKVLPAGASMPVPEWEGQFLAVGKNLYYSAMQNNTLSWVQPTASNAPVLPANVVVFESGSQNPPSPRAGSGRIYSNLAIKDNWYLSGGQWIKLGATSSNSNFEIISGRSAESWQGNYLGLLNPSDPNQDNCLLIKKYLLNTNYYVAIQSPSILSLGGSDDNLFYFELWRDNNKILISTYAEAKESLGIINTSTSVFTSTTALYRLGLYIRRNSTKLYLNFAFNMDTRLLAIKGVANVSYGY